MSNDDLFSFLGATEKESATYLRLLALGAQPVSVIARHMNLPRSSMYSIIEHMKEIGLLAVFQRSGILYVRATPSADLPKIITKQQKHLEYGLRLIEERMPELSSIENTLSVTPRVTYYEGKKAVMSMYEKILTEPTFCSLFNPKLVKKIMPEYHYKIGNTIRENKLPVRELLTYCSEGLEYQKLYRSRWHDIRFLPKKIQFASDTIITNDKIYMISYGESEVTGTEIANPSLHQTQYTIFNMLWGESEHP